MNMFYRSSEEREKKKKCTQNSTLHKRKGQFEDEHTALLSESFLQTSPGHIFLQNCTENTQKKKDLIFEHKT